MGKGFASKLAISNIKKNRKFYLPYMAASVGVIMMFYIMMFLATNDGLGDMAGAAYLSFIMMLGVVIIGIFSFIFILYINSFLMKRRQNEIGLYNILGMEKKHISRILFIENVVTSVLSIVAGLVSGIVFSKLIFMILCKTMKVETPIGFEISVIGIVVTVIVFGAIFFLTLLKNQLSVRLSKPIELLKGSNVGEKEPKSKHILTIIGFLCLGIGYYIGITTDNPLSAIVMFFIAVLLVIAGTYILFITGSITILKALRKNKKFYYKPGNFTAVSGMIYRMKQNAVGLANICILSTMVLVMISTTVCLRVGIDGMIDSICPGQVSVRIGMQGGDPDAADSISQGIKKIADEEGVEIDSTMEYVELPFLVNGEGDDLKISLDYSDDIHMVSVISLDDYEKVTGKSVDMATNQVLVAGDKTAETFALGDKTFTVKDYVDQPFINNSMAGLYPTHYIVVANNQILQDMYNQVNEIYNETIHEDNLMYNMFIYSHSSNEKLDGFEDAIGQGTIEGAETMTATTRYETEEGFYGFSGGFLFLGLFLGIVFTFAAALIIYYKQISEGYYDKDKFEVMQKVGMGKDEVKKSIKKQVLMVFFIPLVMAALHTAAAFNLIRQLLALFSLYNAGLFATCMVVTFVIFALIYGFIYSITAREYYKIIQQD